MPKKIPKSESKVKRALAPPDAAEGLRELHFFMRLAREWDLRFERLVRVGSVSKWYSAVGNEATTVAAATAIEAGDALATLHRDSGAILRYYLDPARLFPDLFAPAKLRKPARTDPRDILYRLACQMLGKADGFSCGLERSYHYSLLREDEGILHLGMISHLGAMIPVAAGLALAFKQRGSDRVAINFIGDGGTSTGDFHEGLNMAAVLSVPLILIVENNGYAFSTPASEQYAASTLAERGTAYGIPGIRVDGNDPIEVLDRISAAVSRARNGGGPTLVEAMLGRMRGHSEGDDSLQLLPAAERKRYEEADPVLRFEAEIIRSGVATREYVDDIASRCSALLIETVDRALASTDPDTSTATRGLHAR